MAEGVVKRHSSACRSKGGRRCNCGAGYEACVSLTRNGVRHKRRRTFSTEAEARAWRSQALAAIESGALRPSARDKRTLAVALTELVAGMREGTVRPRRRERYKPATVRSYEQHVRLRLVSSALGAQRVSDVNQEDVQAWVDERLAAGDSPGTVANALCPIQAFYRRSKGRTNPAVGVDIPESERKAVRIATGAEASRLLQALMAADRPLWATGFYAGLRRGELQALRWRDIDLASSLIRVERGWDQYEGEQAPKTTTSVRTVPLLAILRDYLDEHKLRTRRGDDSLVFGRTVERPFSPPSTDRRAKSLWEAAGLEPITLHECRHCFASLLIDAGSNAKAVQTFMGHSKIQTTFDVYGHLMPGSHDEVRDRMDLYLAEGREAPPLARTTSV